jgi:hypothetical protein
LLLSPKNPVARTVPLRSLFLSERRWNDWAAPVVGGTSIDSKSGPEAARDVQAGRPFWGRPASEDLG